MNKLFPRAVRIKAGYQTSMESSPAIYESLEGSSGKIIL